MSLGYTGKCKKISESDTVVVYSYAGENWNDDGVSKIGDLQLQDGLFTIEKVFFGTDLLLCLQTRKIVINMECKNAFRRTGIPIDFIAWKLLQHIQTYFELHACFPVQEAFIQ